MDVTTIAVPATIVLVLTYVFQMVKPILERVPGLRPTDGSHNDGLRLVYAALSFAAVLGYALNQAGGTPGNMDAWLNLLVSVCATATTMTVGGHYLYQKVSGGGPTDPAAPAPALVAPSTPPDLPPGAPSIAALGLPDAA